MRLEELGQISHGAAGSHQTVDQDDDTFVRWRYGVATCETIPHHMLASLAAPPAVASILWAKHTPVPGDGILLQPPPIIPNKIGPKLHAPEGWQRNIQVLLGRLSFPLNALAILRWWLLRRLPG